jgi:hypothetical protein
MWQEDNEEKEEDNSHFGMKLRRWEDTGNWKRKHYIALSGEFTLEEAMDLL